MKRQILAGLALLGLASCDTAADPANIGGGACSPLDYGAGVFYFPCIEAQFGNALARFVDDHPELRVTAMAGNGTGTYGHERGYFVTTERLN